MKVVELVDEIYAATYLQVYKALITQRIKTKAFLKKAYSS